MLLLTKYIQLTHCRTFFQHNIIQDLGQMKIKYWLTCVQDRAKWKDVVEKAKTSN